jgi:hypothetical protein
MQNHRDDLFASIAHKVELRVDNPIKELILAAREDRKGGLPTELCFEMIALEHHIEDTEIKLVFADVIAGCGGIERDFAALARKLGSAQFWSRTVAVLVQDQSVYLAVRIARETGAGSDRLSEKFVRRRRENGDGTLSGN